MKSSFVMYQHILERLAQDPELENIILGTGVLARDMQTKLRLLNLKAPFLVGRQDDPDNGIWHYEQLKELKNREHYRFIMCFDVDEWDLIAPVQSAVYRFLGIATLNHPRFLRLTIYPTLDEIAGGCLIDANMHDIYLQNGLPYVRFAKDTEKPALNIHILGASSASALWLSTPHCWPEYLYEILTAQGMNAAVYDWAKPIYSTADCLTEFLRDGCFHHPDIVILYNSNSKIDPLRYAKKNLLSIQASVGVHHNIRRIHNTYKEEKNNGIDHTIDFNDILTMQHRVFKALSKYYGFDLWTIIPPAGVLLPEKQAQQLLGLSSGYLERARKRKDLMITSLADSTVLDYTDSFSTVDDIFDVYAETSHLTDKGNKIIAERCAKDILHAFGNIQRNEV